MGKRSRAAWERLVREWRDSGLSAREFGAKRRLRAKTLQWWSSKLKRDESAAAAGPTLHFIEMSRPVAAVEERFEIHLANGRRVLVPPTFDAAALSRLVSALEAEV